MSRQTTTRQQAVEEIIREHTLSAVGVGLLPVPALDFAALMVIQYKMIKTLAELYGVPFFKEVAQNFLSSLISGAVFSSALPLMSSVIKMVPVIGQAVGMLTMPVACGASTYAAGKVFAQHFESGGTLLTFDPKAAQRDYRKLLQEGSRQAKIMKQQGKE